MWRSKPLEMLKCLARVVTTMSPVVTATAVVQMDRLAVKPSIEYSLVFPAAAMHHSWSFQSCQCDPEPRYQATAFVIVALICDHCDCWEVSFKGSVLIDVFPMFGKCHNEELVVISHYIQTLEHRSAWDLIVQFLWGYLLHLSTQVAYNRCCFVRKRVSWYLE